MVNNSTNIKKKKNEQSPLTIITSQRKRPWHMTLEKPLPRLGQAQQCGMIKLVVHSVFGVCFVDPCLSFFVVIVLSVLRFTASDYPFGIFKNVLLTALIILLLWSFITNWYHFGLVVCLGKLNNNKCVYIYSLLIYKYKQI